MLVSHNGVLDKESIIQSHLLGHATKGFEPSFDTVIDFTGVKEIRLSAKDLLDLPEELKKTEKRTGRGAMVIGGGFSRFAFAKLFCDISAKFGSAEIRHKAFRTMEEAEAWLDADPKK